MLATAMMGTASRGPKTITSAGISMIDVPNPSTPPTVPATSPSSSTSANSIANILQACRDEAPDTGASVAQVVNALRWRNSTALDLPQVRGRGCASCFAQTDGALATRRSRSMTDPTSNSTVPWHARDAASVQALLGCDANVGLSSRASAQQMARFGPNALPEPPKRPVWLLLLRQFKSPLIYILFIAAALAAAMAHTGDAAVILAVVLVNALIGAGQEGRAEASMAALRRHSTLQVRVVRDGRE